jgi:hypothetical protein
MARFYADQNFSQAAITALRERGHEITLASPINAEGRLAADDDVVKQASDAGCILLTMHPITTDLVHAGIIVCTFDPNFAQLAERIHAAVGEHADFGNQVVRIGRAV